MKNSQLFEETLHQGRHSRGQGAYEKVMGTVSHRANVNENK